MLRAGRRWFRSCEDCRRYVHHEEGELAGQPDTMPRPDGTGGVIHLPVLRPPGQSPPCDECPKIAPDQPEKHWRHAAEFEPWFWQAWEHFEQGRAVGDLASADPLMRAVYALFHRHAERLTAREFAAPVLDFLAQALSPR